MKTLLVIFMLVLAGVGIQLYMNKDVVEKPYVKRITPDGIPDTLSNGKHVQWDSTWWDAWNQGEVFIIWEDSTDHNKGMKGLIKVVNDTKPWMRTSKY